MKQRKRLPASRLLLPALAICLTLCFAGCARAVYRLPWDDPFCTRGGRTVTLTVEEKTFFIGVLNAGDWRDDPSGGAADAGNDGDFVFSTASQTVRYQPESGTFRDVTRKKVMTVSAEDRDTIHGILFRAS